MDTESHKIVMKVRVHDTNSVIARMKTAREVVQSDSIICDQCDIFFNTERGCLKMRTTSCLSKRSHELVYYDQQNVLEPTSSVFNRLKLQEYEASVMKTMLTKSNGILGILERTRQAFTNNRSGIRIHFDRVHGLGYFMEIQVSQSANEAQINNGQKVMNELTRLLKIDSDKVIPGTYFDEYLKEKEKEKEEKEKEKG